jgi:protein-S-isoprenylcysteine O-methyltransferase Ste14
MISSIELRKKVGARMAIAIAVLLLLLFIPAGTWTYWQAWLYVLSLLFPMTYATLYFLKHDPEFLERRLQSREQEPVQKRIVRWGLILFILAFLVPGLDRRFGWSHVPTFIVIVASGIVFLSYLGIIQVFKANSYAARTIRVEKGQKLAAKGPYAIVRHPMYACVVMMYVASPIALGSVWGLLPAMAIIPLLIARIKNEEEVLERELIGYKDYEQQTRYRLVPGAW